MIGRRRIRVAVAFVGFGCVGEELAGAFEDGGGLVEKNDWFERTGREFEKAVLGGFFFRPPIRRKVPEFGGVCGHGPFGEGKNGGADDGSDGTLGARVKFADGFDRVAKQLDADGARRFGRKKINDAAALRELAGHLDHFGARVADGAEVRDERVEADFIVGAERAREDFVTVVRAMAPKRGGNGRDDERSLSGGEAEERGGATFENVRVRTARVPRKRVKRGKYGDVAGVENVREEAESFRERFREFVGCDEKERGSAKLTGKVRGEQRLGGGLQTGKLDFCVAGAQGAERAFDSGKAQEAFQSFANYGKNHRMAL